MSASDPQKIVIISDSRKPWVYNYRFWSGHSRYIFIIPTGVPLFALLNYPWFTVFTKCYAKKLFYVYGLFRFQFCLFFAKTTILCYQSKHFILLFYFIFVILCIYYIFLLNIQNKNEIKSFLMCGLTFLC